MDVTPLVPEGRQFIEAYGNGGFRITGEAYRTPVIVFPDQCIEWPGGSIETISPEGLSAVFEAEDVPEILLVGTGAKTAFVPPSIRAAIRERGPVIDVMDTGAACRTYNILMTEARRVAAALIPID